MMSTGLVTFGDGSKRWHFATKRLVKQAKNSGYFSSVEVYNFNRIEKNLTLEDKKFILANSSKIGYFLFKPISILQYLEENPSVNIVVYLDAGSEINTLKKHITLFNQYVAEAKENGYVAFQLQNIEENWTKADLGKFLKSSDSDMKSGQIAGGHLIFNRIFAIEHCRQWLEVMRYRNYCLLDDSPSQVAEAKNFVSHRHDQSVSSLLLKKNPIRSFRSASEMEPLPGEFLLQDHLGPFIAARNASHVSRLKDNFVKKTHRRLNNLFYSYLEKEKPLVIFEEVRKSEHF
jgi:hypothetical protein